MIRTNSSRFQPVMKMQDETGASAGKKAPINEEETPLFAKTAVYKTSSLDALALLGRANQVNSLFLTVDDGPVSIEEDETPL